MAKKAHSSVNGELLAEILKWQKQGLDWKDILNRLRPRTVPPGYTYHPWKSGIASSFLVKWKSHFDYNIHVHHHFIGTKVVEESEVDMLRSILAQLEFRHVRKYDESGVPFWTYLHVPEIHSDSGTVFYEREDEGHVFLRYTNSITCIILIVCELQHCCFIACSEDRKLYPEWWSEQNPS